MAQQARFALVHYVRGDLVARMRGFQTRWLDLLWGGGGYVCRMEALLPVVLNTCKSEPVRPEIVCASRWIFGDSLRGGVGVRENTSCQVRDKMLIPWHAGEGEMNLMKYFAE